MGVELGGSFKRALGAHKTIEIIHSNNLRVLGFHAQKNVNKL